MEKIKDLPITEPNHFIRVKVFYQKDGHNWFSGETTPRGYYLSAQKVKLEDRCVSFHLGTSGYKSLLAEAKAFSAKKLTGLRGKVLDCSFGAEVKALVVNELRRDGSQLTAEGEAQLRDLTGH